MWWCSGGFGVVCVKFCFGFEFCVCGWDVLWLLYFGFSVVLSWLGLWVLWSSGGSVVVGLLIVRFCCLIIGWCGFWLWFLIWCRCCVMGFFCVSCCIIFFLVLLILRILIFGCRCFSFCV